jgi:hypothetical protein
MLGLDRSAYAFTLHTSAIRKTGEKYLEAIAII